MRFQWMMYATVAIGISIASNSAFACAQSLEDLDRTRELLTNKVRVSTFSPKGTGDQKNAVKIFATINSIYTRLLCPSVTAAVAGDSQHLETVVTAAENLATRGPVTSFKIWKFAYPTSGKREDAWALLEMQNKTEETLWVLVRYDEQQASFIASDAPEDVQNARELITKLEVVQESSRR